MDGIHGECGKAYSNILGSFIAWSAVADPFAFVSDHGLASLHQHVSALKFLAQRAFQNHSELLEFGCLAWFHPTAWGPHVGNAEGFRF